MPDCSRVTLSIPSDHVNDRLRRLLETVDWPTDGVLREGSDVVVFEVDEEGWGADNGYLTMLYEWLVAARVPFRATDDGHYTWDGFEIGYDGQMDTYVSRTCRLDGGPTLATWELAAIVDFEPESFKTAVLAHFAEDPAGWANIHAAA